MDSLTQIVLGAAVAEAVAGRKMGAKAAMWGAIAGTIPDLDVFLRAFYHPIDAALVHRGFSHSILFSVIFGPVFAWLTYHLYKKKYELKTWRWLWFLTLITHPILDMFTNYGTEFLWPISTRITFNTVFVVDPLYTVPFMFFLLVALFTKRESERRRKWNMTGIYYSSGYLLWGVIVKLFILSGTTSNFKEAGYEIKTDMVTPMPFTSFYWMMLVEDEKNFYVGYKSLFYAFEKLDIDTVPKNQAPLDQLKWKGKNYSETLKFISKGCYTTEMKGEDTLIFYDMRFGLLSKMTANKEKNPLFGYEMVIDNNTVQKTDNFRGRGMSNHLNFGWYINKIFNHE